MTRDEVLNTLRAHMPEIKQRFGVKRLGIFGSVARDEATPHSDVDILVEFEKDRGNIKDIGGLYLYLENILKAKVDIITANGMRYIRFKDIKKSIEGETIYV